jgi:gas vesicle protein GvpN
MTQRWADSRLTIACREGFTLVYDEFTRSRPEANNVMLSVLEEKLLVLPTLRNGSSYLKVHPKFSVIFTSNPEDYAGVHKTQDALRDRMITIYLDYFDRETEVMIIANRSDLDIEQSGRIADMVRATREREEIAVVKPTVRAAIMIGRTASQREIPISAEDPRFLQVCYDVLGGGLMFGGGSIPADVRQRQRKLIKDLVEQYCTRY